jgi:hypothetical protein
MKLSHDPLLVLLLGALALSLLGFMTGNLPYPFGLLVLSAFIAARIFYRS